jgi:hypothetical protein
MENKKTIRNPFPWIGKVFKYEMKHSVRILLPVYIAIIAIALITGFFIPLNNDGNLDFNFSYNIDGNENVMNGLAGFFFLIYWVIIIVAGVVTIGVISKRFKNGLLGDEAYLNLSLPVTIGEHLWGRILMIIVWGVISLAVMLISFIALCIKNLSVIHFEADWIYIFFGIILFDLSWSLCILLFTYLVNAIGHLSKKHRTMVKLIAIIAIISLTSRMIGGITFNYLSNSDNPGSILYWNALFAVIISAIFGTATYFILKLKLNLE